MATSSALSTTNDRIKYTITITQNSQSVANNTSNVTVSVRFYRTNTGYTTYGSGTVYLKINGTTYTETLGAEHKITNSGIVLITRTLNIAHNSDGTKTLATSAWISHSQFDSSEQSYSQTLTTIPRKSTMSVSNGTLGTAQTLKVTKKATSFTHTITYTCGSASGTICTKSSSTSISWTPPLSLASQNTTGTSVTVKFTLTTYSGSTNVGSNTYQITCTIPSSVAPTCTVTVTDSTGYASTYGGYLKGLSKFKVTVTATTAYGSAISAYKTTANGLTYTSTSFTTDVLKSSGTLTIKSTVTDKRGRSGSASTTATVLNYAIPTVTAMSVIRCDSNGKANDKGAYVKVTFSGTVTSLSSKNTATYKLEYKKTSDTSYTAVTLSDYANKYSVTNASYIFAADTGSSYNVRITIADKFKTGSRTDVAPTGFTLMHWLANGLGMAIGKVAELTNVFDIGFQTRFFGGILHPVLEPNTDLNNVRTPNTYVGENISTYAYLNCPITSGTFTLEVDGMGDEGQVRQKLTSCSKTAAKTYERIYYSSAWGEWVCTSDYGGTLLASPGQYMNASQSCTLSQPVSKQRSGIVLVFSRYSSSTAQNYHFTTHFVPKYQVAKHSGCGHLFMMGTDGSFSLFAAKYLYIFDDHIDGNANNSATGTGDCGIKYTNNGFVLRYVIGV